MDYLTKDQVDVLKQEIDVLMSSKYQSKREESVRESTLQELESRRVKEHENVLENWKVELENLRSLKLTLAYEPTRTNILTFSNWAKKNVAEDVILDINIDPAIVAGAQIIWNGKYQDHAYIQRLLN